MVADDEGYKKTLFDKRGPEAAQFNQIVSSLIIPVVAGGFIGTALAAKRELSAVLVALSALAGAVFGEFIQPTGNRTPYEPQFSEQDAMVMRGEVARALASYEEIILSSPNDPQPRIRAADLYAKNGQRDRAEALYKAVQRLPGIAA